MNYLRRVEEHRELLMRIFGAFLLTASLGAVIQTYIASSAQRSYVECQAAWSQAYAMSTKERTEAATVDREALDQMIFAVYEAGSASESRAAIATYIEARKSADRIRAEHPLPPLPAEVCK